MNFFTLTYILLREKKKKRCSFVILFFFSFLSIFPNYIYILGKIDRNEKKEEK